MRHGGQDEMREAIADESQLGIVIIAPYLAQFAAFALQGEVKCSSLYLAQLRRQAQECDPTLRFGERFVGKP